MKWFNSTQAPIRVYGLPPFASTGKFHRLPDSLIEQVPRLEGFQGRCAGGRIRFRTNSTQITVRMKLLTLGPDICIPIVGSSGAALFIGPTTSARYAGYVSPLRYEPDAMLVEKTFEKSSEMEDITLYLPRNEKIDFIEFGLDDDALLEAPTPYRYERPIVFYGSSITEGGCSTLVSNSYISLLVRWLDTDIINYGFSGSARGELPTADLIASHDMSIFVLDYDHNAPSVEHLAETHEPFFRRIREAHPDLPILMMTRPGFDYYPDAPARRDVVRATYEHAIAAGDRNVWFIDGESFFGTEDRHACTIDACHPNDLGFYFMAKTIRPVLEEILNAQNK